MKLTFNNPTFPIGEIRITKAFSDHMPRLSKPKACMDFYRENGRFDRQIIVDRNKYLHDGYCAYLTAVLLGVETVGVLMVGEKEKAVEKPAEGKPAPRFKAGDKVKIANPCNGCTGAEGLIGIVTSDYAPRGLLDKKPGINVSTEHGIWRVNEDGCEPYAEDKPTESQPVKLYCVKSYEPGAWLTKGKIYTCNPADNYAIQYDAHTVHFGRWDMRRIGGTPITDLLVPLVRRPAKVGEWVYICDPSKDLVNEYATGTILKITEPGGSSKHPYYKTSMGKFLYDSEYLVLDGYHGEAES